MIVEGIVFALHGLFSSMFTYISSVLPSPATFWADFVSGLTQLLGVIPDQILWFVPLQPLVTAGAVMWGITVALGLVRLMRRGLSLFTGGGGMA